MRKLFLTVALIGAATPALASQPKYHFTNEGDDYYYDLGQDAHGAVTITGQVAQTSENFKLVLVGKTIRGAMGNNLVDMKVSDAQVAELNQELAAAGVQSEKIAAK